MSFDGLFDAGGSSALPPYAAGGVPTTRHLSNPAFTSPGLSLGLGEMGRLEGFNGSGGDSEAMMRNREDENESRSGGSDNLDCGSGDDIDPENHRKRKRYHRHTPQQIQELEGLFKECPHPDEKQRMELSKRLNLDPRQVKFWFQNRRTQMKTQIERHENSILRAENDKLRAENLTIREAMRSPACGNCGGPAMLGEVSLEEQHLRIENARLKDELDRVCGLASRFLGRPMFALSSPFPDAQLDLGVGSGGFPVVTPMLSVVPGGDFSVGSSIPPPPRVVDRSMLLELALAAMDELVKLAQLDSPLWIPNLDGRGDVLNLEEYSRASHRCVGPKPAELISEATRETGIVLINITALVDSFMDASRWANMFPSIVAKAVTVDIISNGMGGTRNGALQLDSNGNQKPEESMLILQETSTDAAESLVVYAPVDSHAINLVINGGDSSYVALLPSGFAVLPDGGRGGSLLTIAFQILLTTSPTAELTAQLVDTVKSLFSCTVLKIKSALACDE